jgi:hypothetical protein
MQMKTTHQNGFSRKDYILFDCDTLDGFVLTLLGILGGSLKKRSQKGKIVVSDVWASTAACI